MSNFAYILAQPTQEDVFRSIQTNVSGGGGDSSAGSAFLLLLGAIVVLVVLVQLNRRGQQAVSAGPGGRRVVNHSGKLLREIRKEIGLKPVELRQLKLLSEQLATDGQPAPSPLTLLICPSVLAKAVAKNHPKVDRQVLANLVRRMKIAEQVGE